MKLSKILALLMVVCLTFSLCACSINLPTGKNADKEVSSEIDEDALREEIKAELREELEEEMKELKEEAEKEEKEEKEEREQELKPEREEKEEDKPISRPTSNSSISDDWTDMEFMFDGVKYSLFFDYEDIKNNGWSFDLADYGRSGGYILNKGDKVSSTIELVNDKYGDSFDSFTVDVGFINNDENPKDITECEIWAFGADMKFVDDYCEIELAKGIKFGSSLEEVYAAYGKPDSDDIYRAEELKYTAVTYETEDMRQLRLTVYDDDGVTGIELKKY